MVEVSRGGPRTTPEETVPVLLFGDAELPGPPGDREVLRADLDELVEGRLLVEADPGAGKTHVVWSLCEQTAGSIPHLIIDPEGEYAPLRRDFPYVLVSATPDEGDVPAHPSTAAAITRFLVEHNLSAIFDIYDLDEEDRELFVDNVGRELLRLPRSLWSPRMLLIEEAEQFAPEQGSALSKQRLRSLTKRGRKRGIFTVFNIQQMAHFDKGVAGGIANKLVGRTNMDTSLTRAVKDLGLDRTGRETLKNLPAKRFLARGPAFGSVRPVAVDTAPVETRPARDLAARLGAPPPPAEPLRGLLDALRGLAPESDELTDDPEELRAQLRILREKLNAAPDGASPPPRSPDPAAVELEVTKRVEERLTAEREAAAEPLRTEIRRLRGVLRQAHEGALALAASIDGGDAAADGRAPGSRDRAAPATVDAPPAPRPRGDTARPTPPTVGPEEYQPTARSSTPASTRKRADTGCPAAVAALVAGAGDSELPPPQARMLAALLYVEALGLEALDVKDLARFSGQSPTSRRYEGHLAALRRLGLIEYLPSGRKKLTDDGREQALRLAGPAAPDPPDTRSSLHERWFALLPEPQVRLLSAIAARSPGWVPFEDLARMSEQSPTSRRYEGHRAALRRIGLIAYHPDGGRAKASDLFMPDGSA